MTSGKTAEKSMNKSFKQILAFAVPQIEMDNSNFHVISKQSKQRFVSYECNIRVILYKSFQIA